MPLRVAIPEIEVDAPLVELGLRADGALEVPARFDAAGWWRGGARPGEPGPAVIVGHLDSPTDVAVFYRLRDLEPGDRIEVTYASGLVTFIVDAVEAAPRDAFPSESVYGATERPVLRLITCGGDFDRSLGQYDENLIVYASLAST